MFTVCKHCRRHVRKSDLACPFCGTQSRHNGNQPGGAVLAVAIGTALAIGCGGDITVPDDGSGAGTSATVGGTANTDKGGAVNQGGATSYPSGGMLVPYGLAPTGGTTTSTTTTMDRLRRAARRGYFCHWRSWQQRRNFREQRRTRWCRWHEHGRTQCDGRDEQRRGGNGRQGRRDGQGGCWRYLL
jgi:hypothetical protein